MNTKKWTNIQSERSSTLILLLGPGLNLLRYVICYSIYLGVSVVCHCGSVVCTQMRSVNGKTCWKSTEKPVRVHNIGQILWELYWRFVISARSRVLLSAPNVRRLASQHTSLSVYLCIEFSKIKKKRKKNKQTLSKLQIKKLCSNRKKLDSRTWFEFRIELSRPF